MSPATDSRPDLRAFEESLRPPQTLVKELRDLLGARLVAYLCGVSETRAVHDWADGTRVPRDAQVERLRLAFQVTTMIADHGEQHIAPAWWQGMNPMLGDRSPARLLRDGDLEDVGPQVLSAARQFAAD